MLLRNFPRERSSRTILGTFLLLSPAEGNLWRSTTILLVRDLIPLWCLSRAVIESAFPHPLVPLLPPPGCLEGRRSPARVSVCVFVTARSSVSVTADFPHPPSPLPFPFLQPSENRAPFGGNKEIPFWRVPAAEEELLDGWDGGGRRRNNLN